MQVPKQPKGPINTSKDYEISLIGLLNGFSVFKCHYSLHWGTHFTHPPSKFFHGKHIGKNALGASCQPKRPVFYSSWVVSYNTFLDSHTQAGLEEGTRGKHAGFLSKT